MLGESSPPLLPGSQGPPRVSPARIRGAHPLVATDLSGCAAAHRQQGSPSPCGGLTAAQIVSLSGWDRVPANAAGARWLLSNRLRWPAVRVPAVHARRSSGPPAPELCESPRRSPPAFG